MSLLYLFFSFFFTFPRQVKFKRNLTFKTLAGNILPPTIPVHDDDDDDEDEDEDRDEDRDEDEDDEDEDENDNEDDEDEDENEDENKKI